MSQTVRKSIQRMRATDWDAWFVYTALCPSSDSEILIKVGISTVPYDRLYAIQNNCPYPIELAYFAMVGRKKTALSIEREILNAFADFKTRGEWLRMDMSPLTKKRFANTCREAIRDFTGSEPEWRKATGQQIREAGNVKLGEKFRRFPGT